MTVTLSLPPPRNTTATTNPSSETNNNRNNATTTTSRALVAAGANNNNNNNNNTTTGYVARNVVPSYESRCDDALKASKLKQQPGNNNKKKIKLFVPRCLNDFDDGGAFPEIHVAQYPRHMGNPHVKKKTGPSKELRTVEMDEKGNVSYDTIITSGTNSNKLVYTKHEDVVPTLKVKSDDIALPTEEEEMETKAKTQNALALLLNSKTALDKPSGSAIQNVLASKNVDGENTQFIKYTPKEDAPGYNPAAAHRVIQMVPAQLDPMMPPKHKHVKAPPGPAEDPVPVLHAPVSTKLTKEERDAWNIPACISNWKNTRGYTIPLDKRLAADGRNLRQDQSINNNFATLSESLYVAERQARQEVKLRAQVQKKLLYAEKERKEQQLRDLANQARIQRTTPGAAAAAAAAAPKQNDDSEDQPHTSHDDENDVIPVNTNNSNDEDDDRKQSSTSHTIPETDEDVAAKQRERLRMERRKERERELRLENRSVDLKRKQKEKLEDDRDISEKIALGVHATGGAAGAGDDAIDSRLYNQSGGMDSGFGPEDEYNTYSKPLFDRGGSAGATSASIYRPSRGETEYNADEQYSKLKTDGITSKFQADKGFAGAEGGTDITAGPRTAPVQFEKGK